MATYIETYPTRVGAIQTQLLLEEATRLERKLPIEDVHRAIAGRVSNDDHDALRYYFITRELRHRGVI